MVTVDVFVPQRTVFSVHHLKAQTLQLIHRRLQQRPGLRLLRAPGERTARVDLVSRRRQLDQPFSVHPQQCHTAAHILPGPVGLAPIEGLAHQKGNTLAIRLWILPDQLPDPFDVGGCE